MMKPALSKIARTWYGCVLAREREDSTTTTSDGGDHEQQRGAISFAHGPATTWVGSQSRLPPESR